MLPKKIKDGFHFKAHIAELAGTLFWNDRKMAAGSNTTVN